MSPPKFGQILGCLARSECLVAKKDTLHQPDLFLKIQWLLGFILLRAVHILRHHIQGGRVLCPKYDKS